MYLAVMCGLIQQHSLLPERWKSISSPILRTMMVSLFMVIRYIMLRRLQILFRRCMMPEYPVLI